MGRDCNGATAEKRCFSFLLIEQVIMQTHAEICGFIHNKFRCCASTKEMQRSVDVAAFIACLAGFSPQSGLCTHMITERSIF